MSAETSDPQPSADATARRLHPGHQGTVALERLTALAVRILAAPSAMVSLVDVVARPVGHSGVPAGLVVDEVNLDESLCARCVADRRPLAITDTRSDPRSRDVTSVRSGLVGSFLGVPLTADSGEVVGAVCVFGPDPRIWTQDDVTTLQALAESGASELEFAALARDFDLSRSRWDLAIEAAGIGSFDWDLTTGRLAWDEALVEMFGYGDDDHFDESIAGFNARLHPDDLPRVSAALTRAIDTVGEYEADYRIVLPDGRMRDIQARGRAIGTGGVTTRVLGAAWDVTATRYAERRADHLVDAMPVGFLALRPDLTVRTANRAATLLLDLDAAAVVGARFETLLPTTGGGAFADACRAITTDGNPVTFELATGTRGERWSDVRIWPDSAGFLVFMSDVTARVQAAARETTAAARDRTVAATLQEVLLTTLPDGGDLELAGRYLPASVTDKVGGDWYDAVVRPGGTTTVMIGDVVGHDIAAAATMGQLRSMLRAFVWEEDRPPSTVVTRLDHVSQDLYPGVGATAVVARVERAPDDGQHVLQWTDAGHPPPIVVYADGSVDVLDTDPDLMLGIRKTTERHDHTTVLPPGSTVVLYTDGLVETRTADLDDGIGWLTAALSSHHARPLADMLDHVVADLVGDSHEDDIAVIAVRCPPGGCVSTTGAPTGIGPCGAGGRDDGRHPRPAMPHDVVTVHLGADQDAPSLARRFVAEHASGLPPAILDDAILLVSEIVGNAVQHGRSDVTLRVRVHPPGIGIAVHDTGSGLPVLPHGNPDPTQPGGRGLLIVAALADAWGVTPTTPPPGKTVWFELSP